MSSKKTRKSRAIAARKRSTEPASSRPRVAYLGLGSNVGDRRAHLTRALAEIGRFAPLRRVSAFYRTDPVGYTEQRRFWNAVAEIPWAGSAEALLRAVKEVERRGGRVPTFAGGPREIDVDILDLASIVKTRDPVLPHPRLAARRFVLAPLAEIAPEWKHPVTGLTAKQMLAGLPARPGVRKINDGPRASREGDPSLRSG
jgi:2-amino-4-hydroxy-6-hydroxymethyldihydropteridine diphosphokinase